VLRNTLGLKVTEISDFNKTEPHVDAEPVFSDDIVTVYSIPIVPMPHHRGEEPADSEASPNMSENALKRKRESSPEPPTKRSFLASFFGSTVPVPDGPPIPSTSTPLLDRFSADPKFDPVTLEGDEADTWRQLIIERMFTWMELPRNPQGPSKHSNKKGKREKNEGDTGTETPEAGLSQASLTPVPQVPHWVDGATMGQEKPSGRGPKANPAAPLKPLPSFTPPVRDGSTAYIVVGPRVRGKFDAKRAEELGLFGILRGRVARGETVTFTVDDGTGVKVQRTVRPEDCLGEPETKKVRPPILVPRYCTKQLCKVVIILDVPTPDHIESLVSAFSTPAYSPFRVKMPAHRKDYVVHVIYHLLGSNVLEDERYKSFMNGFADDTQHLISSPDHNPDSLTFTSAGLSQLRLNQLDSEMFPLPYFRTTPRKDLSCALLSSHLFGCLTDSRSLC
jgi:ribonuclease Z